MQAYVSVLLPAPDGPRSSRPTPSRSTRPLWMACNRPACTCNDVNIDSASNANASGIAHSERGNVMWAVAVRWSRTTVADPHRTVSEPGADVAVMTGHAGSPGESSTTSATMWSDPPTTMSAG